MTDFKVGDQVQIDPALVNGRARFSRGVGKILTVSDGGTRVEVLWPRNNVMSCAPAHDLVLVGRPEEEATS